jgi:hypothetical protein
VLQYRGGYAALSHILSTSVCIGEISGHLIKRMIGLTGQRLPKRLTNEHWLVVDVNVLQRCLSIHGTFTTSNAEDGSAAVTLLLTWRLKALASMGLANRATKTAVKSLKTAECEGPIRRCKILHSARLLYKYAVI